MTASTDPTSFATTLEVAADFFDADAIHDAPRRLFRYDAAYGDRYYYAAEADAPVRLFPSVTTVIRSTTPMSPFLLRWIADHGVRQAERIRDTRAHYGTLMHALFAKLAIAREFDLDSLPAEVAAYAAKHRIDTEPVWVEQLAQDLVGFADFLHETDFKPLGVEVPLASDELGYGGTLDLVGLLSVGISDGPGKKKVPHRVCGYVDWKSNRNAFYEESAIQGHAYRRLWDEEFPQFPIERVFLYGAKDWNADSEKRYRLKDETGHALGDVFPNLLDQFRMRQTGPLPPRLSLSGRIRVGSDNASCIRIESVEEFLARQHAALAAPVKHAA